jgi:hypothetical protein
LEEKTEGERTNVNSRRLKEINTKFHLGQTCVDMVEKNWRGKVNLILRRS